MYPKYVDVNGKRYKINTDFRIGIECDKVARDESIGDLERALAVIYLLFGEEGINTPSDYNKLLELAKKYLSCGKEVEDPNDEPDMDFIQDYAYIKTSFRSDYRIKLDEETMHWWEFIDLMNGLSNSELGNCCVLNRIRNLRNYDLSTIKDIREREKIRKAQEQVALKKKKQKITKEQEESMERLNKIIGLV